jgi:hypothetical protein
LADTATHRYCIHTGVCKSKRRQATENLQDLRRIYADESTEYAALLSHLITMARDKHVLGSGNDESNAELKNAILRSIDLEIDLQRYREQVAQHIDTIEFSSSIQEPETPVLENLARYRAGNTREFKELLDSLERIRRRRS